MRKEKSARSKKMLLTKHTFWQGLSFLFLFLFLGFVLTFFFFNQKTERLSAEIEYLSANLENLYTPTVVPPTPTALPPTKMPTFTPIPVPACDPASYPDSLVYVAGQGGTTEETGELLKGTVIWQYQNTGGCNLEGFELNKRATYSPVADLGFDGILEITHDVTATKNVNLTRILTFTIDGAEFTLDLIPLKIPANAGEEITLLPPPVEEEISQNEEYSIIMQIVGEVESLHPSDENFNTTGKATLAWTITNNSTSPITLMDVIGPKSNVDDTLVSKRTLGAFSAISDDVEIEFGSFLLEPGKSVIIKQNILYNEITVLTRILRITSEGQEKDIFLSKEFNLSEGVGKLEQYNAE